MKELENFFSNYDGDIVIMNIPFSIIVSKEINELN